MSKKKIAIIGSGISGITCGYHLHKDFDITVFEAGSYIGGHTNTIEVKSPEGPLNIDTGFIVFNDWTYPNFIKMLTESGVESQASDMSFSVKCDETGLEYNGTDTNSLFAQRTNLFKPKFWFMLSDILKFNKNGLEWIENAPEDDDTTLGEFLDRGNYSYMFKKYYGFPITAAIWSAGEEDVRKFPLRFFMNFFKNHGMLSVNERPQWRVIKNGSKSYIPAFTKGWEDKIQLKTPVKMIKRDKKNVFIYSSEGLHKFDGVIFACHSDQALNILSDSTDSENEILKAIPYQANEAVLHTDHTILPKKKLAWAAWNYHILPGKSTTAALTYNMNILQSLDTSEIYNVTLNYTKAIDPAKIIRKINYMHPRFSLEGVKAQKRHEEISGVNNTFYCGAYWRYGFHEDGVVSGLKAVEQVKELYL
ncbi:MAG: FAD-dependent oxidoreductase [Lentisphaeraceae bacterium]|nr:FAD-dependent oxidoreductase [Lentisphaeraceae bacterium]